MYVHGPGLICAVGLTAPSACAAIRAGVSGFVELPYLDNGQEPIIGAPVPGLDHWLSPGERLVQLAIPAIVECAAALEESKRNAIPLLLALPELDRPGSGVAEGAAAPVGAIVRELQTRTSVTFHPRLSRAFAEGHTGGFRALSHAREILRAGQATACLVCGVDSYINAPSLLWLERHSRLKTGRNSDGVIPGEAAAAVLITPAPPSNLPSAFVVSVGFAQEAASVLTDQPLLGLGASTAARAALQQAGMQLHQTDFRLSDVAGESYGFREQSLLTSRLMRSRRTDYPIWHCAEVVGDTGAAAGVCQLIILLHAFSKGYAPGGFAICHTAATGGARASLVMRGHAESLRPAISDLDSGLAASPSRASGPA